MMITPNDVAWIDFAKLVIGPFFGATAAFLFNNCLQHRQQRRDECAAGNVALFTLCRQLQDFRIVRKGRLADRDNARAAFSDAPPWIFFKPLAYEFAEGLRVDFPSLAFLFEAKEWDVFNTVGLAEVRYIDLALYHERVNEVVLEIQEKLSSSEPQIVKDHYAVAALEDCLSKRLIASGNSLSEALVLRLTRDEDDYLSAINLLRDALVRKFGEKSIGKIALMPGFMQG